MYFAFCRNIDKDSIHGKEVIMDYRDNMEIDLMDFALYILRRWKVLLICMVLGAIVAGTFGYVRSAVTVSKSTGEPVTRSASNRQALKDKLTEQSAEFAELSAEQYLESIESYNDVLEHGRRSLILNLNPYEAARLTSMFHIDGSNDNSDIVVVVNDSTYSTMNTNVGGNNSIATAFNNELLSGDVIEEIKSALGKEGMDDASVNEIIRISGEGCSLLSVYVYGENENDVRAVMTVLDEHIDTVITKVSNAFGCKIEPMDSYLSVGADDYLLDIQNKNTYNLATIRNSFVNIPAQLTVDEKAYFTELIADKGDILGETAEGVEINTADDTMVVRTVNKKYIVLGFVVGLFLAAFAFALIYVLSGKIHTADDLRGVFGLSVIGEAKSDTSEFGLLSQRAAIGASKLGSENVYIMGASDDETSSRIRNAICAEMSEGNSLNSVKAGSSAVNDAVSMKELSESDAVVLVEKIDKSRFEDIAREVELCQKFDVKILGAVVVR